MWVPKRLECCACERLVKPRVLLYLSLYDALSDVYCEGDELSLHVTKGMSARCRERGCSLGEYLYFGLKCCERCFLSGGVNQRHVDRSGRRLRGGTSERIWW